MVSPVWYNIRRTGEATYELGGEHDVDISWMNEVRGKDLRGEIVGRILPRFSVDQWDRTAYQELAENVDAAKSLVKLILEQVMYNLSLNGTDWRKYDYDGIVMEIAIPHYFEKYITHLGDMIHALPGNKRLVLVIPPYMHGYPSAEAPRPSYKN